MVYVWEDQNMQRTYEPAHKENLIIVRLSKIKSIKAEVSQTRSSMLFVHTCTCAYCVYRQKEGGWRERDHTVKAAWGRQR